jgi:hypothetical protein
MCPETILRAFSGEVCIGSPSKTPQNQPKRQNQPRKSKIRLQGIGSCSRALFLLIITGALGAPAQAQSLQVVGYSGYLGEWELTATVTETDGQTEEYSGPLTMKHIGLCTQDGPEEKTGEMSFRITTSSSRLDATVSVDGVACTYSGKLSDTYTGVMNCPDRQSVPLEMWVK